MKRFWKTVLLLIAMNYPLASDICFGLGTDAGNPLWMRYGTRFLSLPVFILLILGMLLLEILPRYEKGLSVRLQVLSGGYELIATSCWAVFAEILLYAALFACRSRGLVEFAWIPSRDYYHQLSYSVLILNTVVAVLVLLIHFQNGFWRTAFCSGQLGISLRLLMFFFWWLPPVNLILFQKWCSIVRRELITARNRYRLDQTRVENAICRTRYPVVMVHGIFFRDWQYMNYWGRIPQALKRNGATVFYGKQQSSLPVAESARELECEIRRILAETGAEKVNIVAHSKGGLDSRYAISMLGLDTCVASLTTVNTPHRGCQFADDLLGKLPQWLIHFVEGRYNALFHALGDTKPNFLGGVTDLTASSCEAFNRTVTDSPAVFYQSVMSKMRSFSSSGFPLNLSYLLSKKFEGDNDGLVSVSSAAWGNYLGLLTAGRKGISHADMIDLTHKDVKGFDVSEFYVSLFSGLREKGF